MGLFDRLFGRKKKEENTETPAVDGLNQDVVDTLPSLEASQDRDEEQVALEQETVSADLEVDDNQVEVLETPEQAEMASDTQAPFEQEESSESEADESSPLTDQVLETSFDQVVVEELNEEDVSLKEKATEETLVDSPADEALVADSDQDAGSVEAVEVNLASTLAGQEDQKEHVSEETVQEDEEGASDSAPEVQASEDQSLAENSSQETEQDKYDRSLKKTRKGFGARLNAFFANFRTVDEDFFEELEELLILSDVGVSVATNLVEDLRYEAKLENAKKPDALRRLIIEKLVDIYEKDGQFNEALNLQTDSVTVMLFVGVNGVGKTTSIGKLAYQYKQAGKKVMLVAADTFRAGAVAQLEEWARRVAVPIVTGPEKSDPASVVFDGMERALAEDVDILLIDTAGRLQNKDNLMAELEKIGRIIKRVIPEAPHETLLALDASTGQNALVQAKEFSKITPVTGIVLTKIDGTARGGIVLAIREELDIPVKLIGFGEKIDDIGAFHSEEFMRGLLDGLI
ncbi:signal recognition particle-docking protein FtsY [Streptococcus sp. DD12]|uniref:signal recognition particle-docking protein FtsY n=1 Tax=Streptococcus sp. DD12 TaxID=1777880 RepID=UPI0007953E4D|nr:signal recognition particle-docking protein FtsY [Streptococcus sp. DD12]KXT76915.1 Signal recognition particle receptor protein FtsY, alpha subunit [Streptococcus sp. DD12]